MATKTTTLLAAFERSQDARAHEPAWLRAMRRSAAAAFERQGFPTTKDEEWRFTNVAPVAGTTFTAAPAVAVSPADVARFVVPGLAGPVMVFVNGRFARDLSALGAPESGVTTTTLADALERDGSGSRGAPRAPHELHQPALRCDQHRVVRGRRADLAGRQRRRRPGDPGGVSVHRHALAGRLVPAPARGDGAKQPSQGDRDVRRRRSGPRLHQRGDRDRRRSGVGRRPLPAPEGSRSRPSTSATRRSSSGGRAARRPMRSPSAG